MEKGIKPILETDEPSKPESGLRWLVARLGSLSISDLTGKKVFRRAFRLVRIAAAFGFISFILVKIGWQPVVQVFSNVIWWWVVAKLLLSLSGLVLASIRWKILLSGQDISVPLFPLIQRFWIARFWGKFLPGQFGGDLYRIFAPWGVQRNTTAVGSSVLFDRIAGLIGLMVFLTIMSLIEFGLVRQLGLGLLPIVSILVTLFMVLLVVTQRPIGWMRKLTARVPVARIKVVADDLLNSTRVYTDKKGTILGTVLISMAYLALTVTGTYIGFLALQVDVPLSTVFFLTLLINIISLIPISINAWGLREGAFVLFFTQVGVTSPEALSVALLGRALGAFRAFVGGILYLALKSK